MTPERWAQIEDLFHRAAECDPKQRTALLEESCRNDPELRREVDALLASDRSAGDHVKSAIGGGLKAFTFPLAGGVVSHYRIVDGLGGGGMGVVYRAEDLKLGRRVAIKFLPEESAKDAAALGRFEREARSASALEHQNICPIYEFGEHEGQTFLVMQLLEGQTLRELIAAAAPGTLALTLDKLFDIGIEIANALDAAHRKGIIHRDIKPANIFVTTDGHAKILDFGLAKLARAMVTVDDLESDLYAQGNVSRTPPEAALQTPSDLFLSRTGAAIGTAGYMSPEQVRGETLDARTDLFSLGLVLYEMATGRRALEGDTGTILQEAILKELPTQARQLNPKVPAKLEKIIHKALEKDREARYQSAAEMGAELETLKRDSESRHLVRWTSLAGTVVLLLVAIISYWIVKHPTSAGVTLPDIKLRQLTANSSENPVKGGAISPDGKYLAYVDGKGLHVKEVGKDEAQSVPAPEGLNNSDVTWEVIPTNWFPDSKRFLVNAHPASEMDNEWSSRTTSIWEVSVAGGSPRELRDHAIAWSVSPDGSLISFGTNPGKLGEREIWLMDANGQQPRRLYETSENGSIGVLNFFRDGRRVSFVSTDSSGDTLVTRDLKGGPITTLLPPSEMKKIGDAAWLPDGRLIYSDPGNWLLAGPDRPCNYWTVRLDTGTGAVIERPVRLTNWVGFWMNAPSITADGKRMAFLESSYLGVSSMADVEANGTRLVNLKRFPLEEGGEDAIDDWTADSKSVIVVASRRDHFSLRKQSLNSDTQETIVSGEGGVEVAFPSPEGNWVIAQVRQIPERLRLIRIPITGGSPELIFTVPNWSFSMCARPPSKVCVVAEPSGDHKQAVFTSFDPVRGRGRELARLDLSAESETIRMRISGDGAKLAFAPGPEGPIQIRRLGGGLEHVIRTKELGKLDSFEWAPDGKGLLIIRTLANARAQVVHVDFQGNAKLLWTCGGDTCFAEPSPDGRHLAIYERKINANMWMMENF